MRVLHFMNIPLSIHQIKTEGSEIDHGGGWLAALLGQMFKNTNFTFACATFGKTENLQDTHDDRIQCFVIPRGWARSGSTTAKYLHRCRDLVTEWKPDLLHIHGTEEAYGLLTARGLVKCPTVISLQGLIGPCSDWYRFFGNRSFFDILRMHRMLEYAVMRGQLNMYLRFKKNAKREREIISGNRFFIGRTAWDRAYILAINSAAKYFHGGELLREAFWQKRWDLARGKRHRIIFTNAGHPRKGTEVLLDAVKLLRSHYPDLQVAIAGGISHRSGYGKYIRCRISELGNTAIESGQLNAQQMATELCNSHVFVSPSYIDNSPNAVCEAQMIGMPVLATYTGGVPSLIAEGLTGLFFPTGDAPMLAARLREIFENDALAMKLGSQAHEAASQRHDPGLVVKEILAVYEEVLSKAA